MKYRILSQRLLGALPDALKDAATQTLRFFRDPSVIFTAPHLRDNARFRNIHQGKRCFILCTGPSILKEDLKPLSREICFSVSNFYKHADYAAIRPAYHCVPNILSSHPRDKAVEWLREMHEKTLDATMFLGEREKTLVRQNDLFAHRNVSFLCIESARPIRGPRDFDLTRQMPGIVTVPIMCFLIAFYMGFREIYLLGTDLDWFSKRKYLHFYDVRTLMMQDPTLDKDGNVVCTPSEELEGQQAILRQYEGVASVARSLGVSIVNLSQGSHLEVFPRGTLSAILGCS